MTTKSFKVNSATMLTLFAPKETPYSQELFRKYVTGVRALFKVKDYAAVSEPCPQNPETWHFHMFLPFHLEKQKKKTIHLSLVKKLKALTGQKNEPNFTKPKAKNLWSDVLNNLRYARGLSEKTKEKHDVIESEGIDVLELQLAEKVRQHESGEAPPVFTNLAEQVCYWYHEHGMDFQAQYRKAVASRDYYQMSQLMLDKAKLEGMLNNMRAMKEQEALQKELEELQLWESQKFMVDKIEEATAGRSLPVFVDPVGNSGKSTLQDWLHYHRDHQEFTNAKTSDIAYAYKGASLVTFNLSKATDMNKVNYQAIENLLDGKIFSSKYESGMKRFKKPRVALFCNAEPNFSAMSSDRWQVYRRQADGSWSSSPPAPAPVHIYGAVGDVLASCDKP